MVALNGVIVRYYRYFFLIVFIAADFKTASATEPEYLSGEEPVAPSVEQSQGPMEEAYTPEVNLPSRFPGLKKRLETATPFWRDTQLTLLPRTYSLNRTIDDDADRGAWAIGGQVQYRSGWWQDRVKVGVGWYTSQKLRGRKDKGGTLLLQPGQQSYSVIGEAFVEAKLTENTRARLYRQTFDLPYVNRQDTRMLPITFEAYSLFNESLKNSAIGLSHVTKMKRQNADEFIYMSEAAGFEGTDEPLSMIGGRYTFDNGVTVGAINQYSWEFMNTFYAEADSVWKINEDLALQVSGQYTDQRSVGDELGGDFDTSVYGVKTALSHKSATLTLAYTSTDNNSRIRSPFGGYPGYLSIIINDFNRADEDAWLLGLSYDFTKAGIPGLSGFINYAEGDTPDSGVNATPDQEELNVTVDYRFQGKTLKNIWLRARAAFVEQENAVAGATDVQDYRFIINYELPIL